MTPLRPFLLGNLGEKTHPPCANDCIWYETTNTGPDCLNRHSFVCEKHRADVFGREADYNPPQANRHDGLA